MTTGLKHCMGTPGICAPTSSTDSLCDYDKSLHCSPRQAECPFFSHCLFASSLRFLRTENIHLLPRYRWHLRSRGCSIKGSNISGPLRAQLLSGHFQAGLDVRPIYSSPHSLPRSSTSSSARSLKKPCSS